MNIAWALFTGCALLAWSVSLLRTPKGASGLEVFLPALWILRRFHGSHLAPWLQRRRERALFLSELRAVVDHLAAASAVGLHLRQALPREVDGIRSSVLRGVLVALEQARLLGEDVNARMEREGRRLLAARGEERYAGLLFVNLAVSERLGANTQALVRALRARLDVRITLLRKLRVDTAQVRFQGVVLCIAPFLVGAGYALVFPHRFAFFLESTLGHALLALILMLVLLGGGISWRCVARWTETLG